MKRIKKYIQDVGRKASREAFQAYVTNNEKLTPTPNWFVGKVSANKTHIKHPNGRDYKLTFTGQIQDYTLACIIDEENAFATGPAPLKQQTIGKGKKGLVFVGGWIEEFLLGGGAHFACAQNFPVLGVVNIKDETNFYRLQEDNTLRIFDFVTNSDDGDPNDIGKNGHWFAQFNSSTTNLAVIRLISRNDGYDSGSELVVKWSNLKGISFNTDTSSLDYSSVEQGSLTIPNFAPTPTVADAFPPNPAPPLSVSIVPGQGASSFKVIPLINWDSNGDFTFDLWGHCTRSDLVEYVYSISHIEFSTANTSKIWSMEDVPINGNTPSNIIDNYVAFLPNMNFSFANMLGRQGWNFMGFSGPRPVSAFKPSTGEGANIMVGIGNPSIPATVEYYCYPYNNIASGNIYNTFPSVQGSILALDTNRYYDPNTTAWSSILTDAEHNMIKVGFDSEKFTYLQATTGTGTWEIKLTNQKYDAIDGIVKVKDITGKPIPFPFGGFDGTTGDGVINVMDWIIK